MVRQKDIVNEAFIEERDNIAVDTAHSYCWAVIFNFIQGELTVI